MEALRASLEGARERAGALKDWLPSLPRIWPSDDAAPDLRSRWSTTALARRAPELDAELIDELTIPTACAPSPRSRARPPARAAGPGPAPRRAAARSHAHRDPPPVGTLLQPRRRRHRLHLAHRADGATATKVQPAGWPYAEDLVDQDGPRQAVHLQGLCRPPRRLRAGGNVRREVTFCDFDDGKLGRDDLSQLLALLVPDLKRGDAAVEGAGETADDSLLHFATERCIAEADLDGDGMLNFGEFSEAVAHSDIASKLSIFF